MNSQPLNNDRVYESYKQRFGHCCEFTYWGWFAVINGQLVEEIPHQEIQCNLQRHHLWSNSQRPDFRSNLLVCTEAAHNWMHSHPQEGRVIAVLAKLRKRERLGEPEEFDLGEMFRASGKHVAGVIENYQFRDEAFQRLQSLCLARVAPETSK